LLFAGSAMTSPDTFAFRFTFGIDAS
jgi:hypothetical protein